MKLLVPIHAEISSTLLVYVRKHRADLSRPQAHALMRYAKDPYIMKMMENSFFHHWFNEGERVGTLEGFCQQVITDLLEVYKEGAEVK